MSSLVVNHGLATGVPNTADEIVVGKSQCLTVLVSNLPGNGKTDTAEAVAERTRNPLFRLQVEDLGFNAEAVGANLKHFLKLATKWKAIVLLEEADIFTAKRDLDNVARAELSSTFLRELDHFRGIIFLVVDYTNPIDPAFQNRVDLQLICRVLMEKDRETIWRSLISSLSSGVQELRDPKSPNGEKIPRLGEIKNMAQWELNAEEIVNAFNMTQKWCDFKGYVVTYWRIKHVVTTMKAHAFKERTSKLGSALNDPNNYFQMISDNEEERGQL